MRVRLALPIAFIPLASALATQTPSQAGTPAAIKTVAAIPIYPGAKRVASQATDIEGWERFSQMWWDQLDSLRSEEMISYEVGAHAEAVYEFYKDKLGGKPTSMKGDFDPLKVARGASTFLHRYPWFWIKPDANTKAIFANRPTIDKPDQWLCVAGFWWLIREENGDATGIMVAVRDAGTVRSEGIAKQPLSYSPKARIVIKRATWVDPDKVPPKFGLSKSSPFYCF